MQIEQEEQEFALSRVDPGTCVEFPYNEDMGGAGKLWLVTGSCDDTHHRTVASLFDGILQAVPLDARALLVDARVVIGTRKK